MTISTQPFCINNVSQCYKLSIPTIVESKDSCPVWIFSRSPASLEMTSNRAKSLFGIVENSQIFCIFGMLVRIRLKRSKIIRADVPLSSIGLKADRRAPVSAINDSDEVNKKITDKTETTHRREAHHHQDILPRPANSKIPIYGILQQQCQEGPCL